MSRRALFASAHYWGGPFQVGGHHLARALARMGWEVAFVSNPISPLHLASGVTPDLQARFAIYRGGGISDQASTVRAYVPGALLTPHRAPVLRSAWVHRNWHRLTIPNAARTIRGWGFGAPDVLYVDTVVQAFWPRVISPRASVFRVADMMSGFSAFTPEMLRLEGELARGVDLVAFSALGLEGHVASLGPRRSLHLPNGVEIANFQDAAAPQPADLESVPRPRAIYVGAMDEWFDFDLVNQLAGRLENVSFVLVGPDQLARRRLRPRSNLFVLGRRPYDRIASYMRACEVGLIPFDTDAHGDLVATVHPLKLYEYLACGIPVVAARWAEIERLGSPAVLCTTLDDWAAAIAGLIDAPPDPGPGRLFAQAADWSARASRLLDALGL